MQKKGSEMANTTLRTTQQQVESHLGREQQMRRLSALKRDRDELT